MRTQAARALVCFLAAAVCPLSLLSAAEYAGSGKEPIYIGSQACGHCHDGPQMGHQFSKWRLTAHAKAYAALSAPESKEIAKLSGITEEPYKSRMCLGCHATASEEEDWQRGDEYHLADGLQCEACHGPGSEYAHEDIMRDREKAVANGLMIPDKEHESCMRCHRAKGSHDGVLKKKPFDVRQAWADIAHPLPAVQNGRKRVPGKEPAPQTGDQQAPFKYLGVMACAACHQSAERGFQYSKWRLGPHANAYAALASSRGYELASDAGITGNPQHSPECLKCHTTGGGATAESFAKDFDLRDGVQCESCHGPGSDYSPEAVMADKAAAHKKGLVVPDAKICASCHEKAHGKDFDYATAVAEISHPAKPPLPAAPEPAYKNPLNLTLTPDGKELWVACEASASVVIVDTATRQKLLEIAVGGQPNDIAFTPDGKRAFVSNRLDDSVSVVDVLTHKVVATIEVGDEPHGLLVDKRARYLYVLNTSIDNISVIDLANLKEIKRLSASRSPWSLAQSGDGQFLFVTHALSRMTKDRNPSMSEITVVNTETAVVDNRIIVPGANLMQGIAWHPSGQYALATLLRTKNLVPMTRINHGWTISNGLGIIWRDGTVDQVLLDENNLCFPDPYDVCITPNGKFALVTSSSTDRIAVLDLEKLIQILKSASPHKRQHVIPNHTGKPAEFIVKFIPTPATPRGITCSANGASAYVANMLDDSVAVLDLQRMEMVSQIDLGGARELTQRRRGEKLFHSANVSFRRQFSCSSCHPDGHIDNIVYDIEDDGIGMGPIDNRTLRGINDMAPYKWTGINPNLRRQCGPRLAVFITRINPFTPEQLDDLHYYLCSIPRPPNRYRKLGADLTEAQRRGKAVFERSRRNDGSVIPLTGRCNNCHPPPLYTDGKIHNVGTKFPYDRAEKFDAPHLLNIYDSAPYLHNGIAWTLEEIWTKYNPNDTHGVTNDMTKDQLNDLIEYLKTL